MPLVILLYLPSLRAFTSSGPKSSPGSVNLVSRYLKNLASNRSAALLAMALLAVPGSPMRTACSPLIMARATTVASSSLPTKGALSSLTKFLNFTSKALTSS
ncbi:hypothetical protein D1872_321210 [compost metagenome]